MGGQDSGYVQRSEIAIREQPESDRKITGPELRLIRPDQSGQGAHKKEGCWRQGQFKRFAGRDTGEVDDRGRPKVVRPVIVQRLAREIGVLGGNLSRHLRAASDMIEEVPSEMRHIRVALRGETSYAPVGN